MNCSFFDSNLSEDLLRAIDRKGYELSTPIQRAVLQADSTTTDLRITSITGSGKTLAIGFALRDIANSSEPAASRRGPLSIIIVPTRELAKQVQSELSWLFQERKWRVESLTGGTSIRDERRALAASPTIIVATPGRLLDHLRHNAIDTEQVAAVVLDEADRMLDMGFQEDLQAILETMPSSRRTHMASATFCDEVGRLANRYQSNPVMLRGAPQDQQVNEDIDHIVHVVNPGQKFDAIVNLLLDNTDEQAIIFMRTRADVTAMTRELEQTGFHVASLSGEMTQPARDRALATFRRGSSQVLVATDVAARGLDIQGVTQIIHMEPPGDPDSYVHRSGRTGRAGKKGTSRVLVVPAGLGFVKQIMRRAGTKFRVLPIPTAENLLAARDQRLFDELSQSPEEAGAAAPGDRLRALAERLLEEGNVVELVSRLLTRVDTVGIAPRQVRSPRVEEERRPDFSSGKRASFNKRPAAPLQNTQHLHRPQQVQKPQQVQRQQQAQRQQQVQRQQQPQKPQQLQMQSAWPKDAAPKMNRKARRAAQFAAQAPA